MTEGVRWNREIYDRTTDGLAPVRDIDWAYQPNLARPVYDPWAGMSREYVWTDDAACSGVNPELFQMSQAGDPGLEGIGKVELRKFNEQKAEQAKSYCEGCPVRATCLERAEASDLYWSVRGGETPTSLVPLKDGSKRKFPAAGTEDWVGWHCKKHGRNYLLYRSYVNQKAMRPYCGRCSGE